MNAFLLLSLLAPPVQASPDETEDSRQPHWTAYTGFPWTGGQFSPSSAEGFDWIAQAETALFRRWEASAGLRYLWSTRDTLTVQVSLAAGWISQQGVLTRQGLQTNFGLRVQHSGQVVPRLEHRSTAFWAQAGNTPDYQGLQESVGALSPLRSHTWELGLGIPVPGGFLLEPAMRFGSVDSQFALPALSMGLRSMP